jgi:hypothetical protein
MGDRWRLWDIGWGYIIEEGERQVKVLIKNLAIFFLCPSKQFLLISFQIQLMEYFFQNQREQRHMLLGCTDKMVTPEI